MIMVDIVALQASLLCEYGVTREYIPLKRLMGVYTAKKTRICSATTGVPELWCDVSFQGVQEASIAMTGSGFIHCSPTIWNKLHIEGGAKSGLKCMGEEEYISVEKVYQGVKLFAKYAITRNTQR